jgi:hypothetical protein
MATQPPTAPPPGTEAAIVYLESCLKAAKEGRLLFLIASAGLLGDEAPRDPLLIDIKPRARQFKVDVGGFLGDTAENIDALVVGSAFNDTAMGARHAIRQIAETIQKRVNEATPPGSKVS